MRSSPWTVTSLASRGATGGSGRFGAKDIAHCRLDICLTGSLNTGMDDLSTTFFALSDPTRRAIVARLAKGQTHVGEPFRVSAPAISRHLRVLEEAGLIERKVEAQRRVCSLRGEGLAAAHHWVEQYRQFWEAGLDRLVEFLEAPSAPPIGGRRAAPRKRMTSASPRKAKTAVAPAKHKGSRS